MLTLGRQDVLPRTTQEIAYDCLLFPKSTYAAQAMPATATVNWATITHTNPPISPPSPRRSPLLVPHDAGAISDMSRALKASLMSPIGLVVLMASVVLLAILYIAACTRALKEVNDRFQMAMEMAARRRDFQDGPSFPTAELSSRMNIECGKNQDAIEALKSYVQSKTEKDRQTYQSGVGALTSDLEVTKLGFKAEVATAQADITSLKEREEALVKDVRSVQEKRHEDRKAVGELLNSFELRFLQLEDRIGKAEANSAKKDGALELANQRIEKLEGMLKDAVQEKNDQKKKFEEQEILNKAQQKELDGLQKQLDKSRNKMVANEDRLVAVEDLAAKTTRSLKPLKDALKEDLANIIWASAQQTAYINDFTTNLATLSKVVTEDIRPALGTVKKGLKSLWAAVRDNVRPTLGGVQKSIDDLQRDNPERDLKLDSLTELVNSLTKTVKSAHASSSGIKDDLQTSINTVAEDIKSAQDFFTNRLELTDKDLERLEEDVDDAKKQIVVAKTDIESLQKKPDLTAEIRSLTSPVQKYLSTAEYDFTSLKAEVSTQGKKQAKTEKRLQEQGNKIEGHSRQLNGIQLALKSLDEVCAVALPVDRTRSARQQRRKAAKQAEKQASESTDCALSAHVKLSIDVPGSRYAPDFESDGSSELDDAKLAPTLSTHAQFSDEVQVSNFIADSEHRNSSTSIQASNEDAHEKSSASSLDQSSPQDDSISEPIQADKPSDVSPKSNSNVSPDQSITSSHGSDVPSTSDPDANTERSTIVSRWSQPNHPSATTPTDASPESSSNVSPEQSTTSSHGNDMPSGSTPDVSIGQSAIISQWSQPNGPSPHAESSRARRWRVYQKSISTDDGYYGQNGQWLPNNPKKSRGGGREDFRGSSNRGNHQPFQNQATFQQQSFPQPSPFHLPPPFQPQESFHQQLSSQGKGSFAGHAPDQFDMAWDTTLG